MRGVTKKIAAVAIVVALLTGIFITLFARRKADNADTMPLDRTTFVKAALNRAISRTGQPYNETIDDCSGFVNAVFNDVGATINGRHTTYDWIGGNLTYNYGGSTYSPQVVRGSEATTKWYDNAENSLEPGDIVSSDTHCFIFLAKIDISDLKGIIDYNNPDNSRAPDHAAIKNRVISTLNSKYGVSLSESQINYKETYDTGDTYSDYTYWYVEGNATTQQIRIRNYNWSYVDSGTKRMSPRVIYRVTHDVQNGSYRIKLGKVSSENLGTYVAGAKFKVNSTEMTTETSAIDAVTGSTSISDIAITNTNSDVYVFEETQAPSGLVKHNGSYGLQVRKGIVDGRYAVTQLHYYSGSGSSLKQGDITSNGKYWITGDRDLVEDSSMSDSAKKTSIAYIETSSNLAEIVYVGINVPDTTSRTVRKVWSDGENQYNTRPQSIQVQLYKNGTAEGNPVTLNDGNNWEYTWSELDKTSGGTDINYEVREVGSVKGYTTASQVSGNTTTITNTLNEEQPEIRKGEIGLYKYEDTNLNGKYDEGEPSIEGAEFKIATSEENARNGVFVKDERGNDLVATSGKDGTAKFENLSFDEQTLANAAYTEVDETSGTVYHKYHWDQVETTYYIKETKAPEGYREITDVISAKAKVDYYNLKDVTSLVQVGNIKKIYDLALRKFITEVQDGFTGEKSKIILNLDDKEEISRVPEVDLKDLKSGKSTTATYNHIKTPVLVHTTDIVTYTLQIYNEGPEDAYASIIKDDIPEGLEFVPYKEGDGSVNDTYRWKMVDENDKEVTDAKKAKYIVTDYLAMDEEEKNLIKAYDPDTMTELDSRFVKVQFKVTEPTTSKRIVTNSAQISKETDANGKVVTDRDSTPNEWLGEDDEDVEHVRVLYFDLALRKWVTHAIVTDNGETKVIETGHHAEDDPEEIVKVDLKKSKLENITVKFKYSIRITNQGEIPGEATEIRDDIPEGLEFDPADNPDWRVENGKVVTNKLEKTTLQPGESAEVEIILTWIKSEDNMGVKVNVAEINKDHNNYGTKDIDSTPGNNVPGEDDIDDAPVMLSIKTGSQTIAYVAMALGFITIVAIGTVQVKRIKF